MVAGTLDYLSGFFLLLLLLIEYQSKGRLYTSILFPVFAIIQPQGGVFLGALALTVKPFAIVSCNYSHIIKYFYVYVNTNLPPTLVFLI